MTYAPAGYLTFNTLFSKIYEILCETKDYPLKDFISEQPYDNDMPWDCEYIIFDLNEVNRIKFKTLLSSNDNSEMWLESFLLMRVSLHKNNMSLNGISEVRLTFSECDNDKYIKGYIFNVSNDQEIIYHKYELERIIRSSQVWDCIRSLLCSRTFEEDSFCLDIYNKRNVIPNDIWLHDTNWYGLFIDGKINNDAIFPGYAARTSVYFKKEIIHLCTLQKQEPPTERMFHINTPWIEIMSIFSLKYGEDIKTISKDFLETEIKTYIDSKPHLKSLTPPISTADITYIAKFVRHPDQRKGKGFKG